ncbi:MAG: dihydropteroate synthase [Planctomyces sp.]|nr:dihydropteroate synthase [Planctomyces sp.]
MWSPSPRHRWTPERPWLIGIINLTPDSFSDGGLLDGPAAAVDAAQRMLDEGADGLDVGGESTRPGAAAVPEDEQIARTEPVIRALRAALGSGPMISIDTTRAAVARAALRAGADAINDVSGATDDPRMLPLAAQWGAGLILMHRRTPPAAEAYSTGYGLPGAPPAPRYADVVDHVKTYLGARAAEAIAAGVPPHAVAIDPGLGFGKSVADNLSLIHGTAELARVGHAVVSGLSRKSFVGAHAGLPQGHHPRERLAASVALCLEHLRAGARVMRVHDVGPHRAALDAAARAPASAADARAPRASDPGQLRR